MPDFFISESTTESIDAAVAAMQARLESEKGEHYSTEELKQLAQRWLENCVESLAEEAMYHWFTGSSQFAFGRRDFQDRLSRLTPTLTAVEAQEEQAIAA